MKIAIIGSGIAGICMARALANLSQKSQYSQISEIQDSDYYNIKNLTIFEKANSMEHALKSSASGNPVGIIHPIVSGDSFSQIWTQKGILTTIRWIKELKIDKKFFDLCGVLHLPRSEKQSLNWTNLNKSQDSQSKFLTKNTLIDRYKDINAETCAVWSPQCGWLKPKEFVKAALKETKHILGGKLKIIFNANIDFNNLNTLHTREPDHPMHPFDLVIIAAGYGSLDLVKINTPMKETNNKNLISKKPALELVNGQITGMPFTEQNYRKFFKHDHILCKSGYVTPLINGHVFSGATYETVNKPHNISCEKYRIENINRLTNLMPQLKFEFNIANQRFIDRTSTRCVSRDKLPVIGLIEDKYPRIYAFTALGSRGISWAPLAAESLAKEVLFKKNTKKECFLNKKLLPNRLRFGN